MKVYKITNCIIIIVLIVVIHVNSKNKLNNTKINNNEKNNFDTLGGHLDTIETESRQDDDVHIGKAEAKKIISYLALNQKSANKGITNPMIHSGVMAINKMQNDKIESSKIIYNNTSDRQSDYANEELYYNDDLLNEYDFFEDFLKEFEMDDLDSEYYFNDL